MTYLDAVKNFTESENWRLAGYSFSGIGYSRDAYIVEVSFQNRFGPGQVELRFDALTSEQFDEIDRLIRNKRN